MLGNEAAMKIGKIPLSIDTVRRRILEMSSNIEKIVCGYELQCSDFALQVDESTDLPTMRNSKHSFVTLTKIK